MVTIGEIIEKLKIEIFPNPVDKLEKICQEREQGIKTYLDICGSIFNDHVQFKLNHEGSISYWRNARIEQNVKKIGDYVELLVQELDKDRIIGHCKHHDRFLFSPFDPDIIFIIFYSFHGSLVADSLWSGDITVDEAMKMSAGNLDLDTLGKHLPNKVKRTNDEVIPYFKNSIYERHNAALKEVLICHKKKLNKACNLLLMTTIEGIVRDLASFLNKKQELHLDLNDPKFNSLDSLLRKGEWKDDFEISKTELEIITQEKEPHLLNHSIPIDFQKIGMIGKDKIKVNLKTRLDFLRRRFKEDRDMILHGQMSDYSSNWHLFINFSALLEVFRVIQHYDKLYANGR